MGSWPTSLGQARSDSGLGCLFSLGVRIGRLLSPSSWARIPSWGSGRPGSLGPGGGQVWDFCPPVTQSPEFRRAEELASKTKTSNRLNGFHSLPLLRSGSGVISLCCPASTWQLGFREVEQFPQGHRASSGAWPIDTPPPVLSRSHLLCWNVS